jgi:hypothetical protein
MTREGHIETLVKSWLDGGGGYIETNSISVRTFGDSDDSREPPCVVVQCQPFAAEFCTNGPLYRGFLTIRATTYTEDDKDRNVLQSIFEDIQDVVETQAATFPTTYAAGGFIVHAIMQDDGGTDAYSEDGNYQALILPLTVRIETT